VGRLEALYAEVLATPRQAAGSRPVSAPGR
jgi:hypothetical protein